MGTFSSTAGETTIIVSQAHLRVIWRSFQGHIENSIYVIKKLVPLRSLSINISLDELTLKYPVGNLEGYLKVISRSYWELLIRDRKKFQITEYKYQSRQVDLEITRRWARSINTDSATPKNNIFVTILVWPTNDLNMTSKWPWTDKQISIRIQRSKIFYFSDVFERLFWVLPMNDL